MIRQKEHVIQTPVIDLTGPEGNAFCLLGYARQFPKKLGWSAQKSNQIIEEMQEGDYENLVLTFDSYFGDFVILER